MISDPKEFQWDQGNDNKNYLKHKVSTSECESAFLDDSKIGFDDFKHSFKEKRLIVIGLAKPGRLLTIAYTIRNQKIRVISARDASKKENNIYEKINHHS